MEKINELTIRRYPGTIAYSDNDLSRKLFFGRKREAKSLLYTILSESLTVLYAKSGNGKTSLLQTKIFQGLREHNYYPILIRFNDSKKDPIQAFYDHCQSMDADSYYEINLFDSRKSITNTSKEVNEENIVDFIHSLEIWSKDNRLFTPVFVFDQFEEMFTLPHNAKGKIAFFNAMSRILRAINRSGLDAKIVISIREDFLGYLKNLNKVIPTIFSNTFRLERLRLKDVDDIIRKPAQLESDHLSSLPFRFDDQAIETIKESLSKGQIDHYISKEDIEINPIQLQIVCSAIEDIVIEKKHPNILIQEKDFNGKKGLDKILEGHYNKQLQGLGEHLGRNQKKIITIRNVIERKLIVNSKRVAVDYDSLSQEEQEGVDFLLTSKLLKEEVRGKNRLIELSHDSLVKPILLREKKRRGQENRKRFQNKMNLSIGVAMIIIFGLIVWATYENKKKIIVEQEKAFVLVKEIQNYNPTLSYQISNEYDLDQNEGLKSYIQKSFQDNYSYMIKRFQIHEEVLFAYRKSENDYHIVSKQGLYRFNEHGLLIEKKIYNNFEIIGANKIGDNDYYMVFREIRYNKPFEDEIIDSKIMVINSKKDTVSTFYVKEPKKCTISSDGHFLVIDNLLYKKNNTEYTEHKILDGSYLKGINTVRFIDDKDKLPKYIMTSTGSYITINNLDGSLDAYRYSTAGNTEIYDFIYSPKKNKIFAGSNEAKIYSFEFDPIKERYIDTNDSIIDIPFNSKMKVLNTSTNEEYFISGGTDGAAIVWDMNGFIKSTLRGLNDPLTFIDFIDEKTLLTGDEAGNIVIWKMDIADSIKHEMINISPFELNSKLDKEETFTSHYKLDTNSKIEGIIEKVIEYTYSIPRYNGNFNDSTQTQILNTSIHELHSLYDSIKKLDKFSKKELTIKKQVFDNQLQLLDKELQLKNQEITNATHIKDHGIKLEEIALKLLEKKYTIQKERLLLDTLEIEAAAKLAERLRRDFVNNPETHEDYKFIASKLKEAIALMLDFEKVHEQSKPIKSKLGDLYSAYAWYCLFYEDFDKSVEMADKSLQLDELQNDWANTNKALGYLLGGKFEEAKEIYLKYKDKEFSNRKQSFRSAFLGDFDDLEKAGIINEQNIEDVNKIRELLGEA